MMLKELVKSIESMKSNISYYSPQDCYILGTYNYSFRRSIFSNKFYIVNEYLNYTLECRNNYLIIGDALLMNEIRRMPIPEDKNEYFQLSTLYDYDGITYENIIEIVDLMKYLINNVNWGNNIFNLI